MPSEREKKGCCVGFRYFSCSTQVLVLSIRALRTLSDRFGKQKLQSTITPQGVVYLHCALPMAWKNRHWGGPADSAVLLRGIAKVILGLGWVTNLFSRPCPKENGAVLNQPCVFINRTLRNLEAVVPRHLSRTLGGLVCSVPWTDTEPLEVRCCYCWQVFSSQRCRVRSTP